MLTVKIKNKQKKIKQQKLVRVRLRQVQKASISQGRLCIIKDPTLATC